MDAFNLIFGLIMIGAFVGLIVSAKKHNNNNAKMVAVILAGVVVVSGILIAAHSLWHDKNAKLISKLAS